MTKNNLKMTFGIMLLSLGVISACGKADPGLTSDAHVAAATTITNTQEIIYRESVIPIPDDFMPVAARFLQEEVFLFDGRDILVIDHEGKELRRMHLSDNEEFAAFDLQPDGSIWIAAADFGEEEAVIGKVPDAYHFVHFSGDGTELGRVRAEGSQIGEYHGFEYPYGLLVDHDDIYLMAFQSVYVLNQSGLLVYELGASGENTRDFGMFKSLIRLNEGGVALASIVHGSEMPILIQFPDPEKQETEEISITDTGTEFLFAAGKEAALFICTSNGFYDCQPESGERRLLFDNLKYGVDAGNLMEIAILPDDSIAVAEGMPERRVSRLSRFIPFVPSAESSADAPDGSMELGSMELGSTEENPANENPLAIGKQVVRLSAVNDFDTWLANAVAGFNRSSEEYYVEMKDYYKDSSEDFDAAAANLNLDLITRNIPDIIVLPVRMSPIGYVNKGLYADLNTFIDNDPDFSRDDYLPGLFEALNWDGKMYEIFPLFMVEMIQGKTKDVGTDSGWTLAEFAAFLDTKPDARYIFDWVQKTTFVSYMVNYNFINPLTGEPHFDREMFKEILRVAERFPDDDPFNGSASQQQIDDFLAGLKDGDPLMRLSSTDGFHRFKSDEVNYFGEETTLKGLPSPTGNGFQFWAWEYLSITAQAENPDGAWAFLKYAMNHAKCKYGSDLPVNRTLLDEMAESEYEKRKNYGLMKADVDKILAAIHTIRTVKRGNRTISVIIREEAAGYFSGQKSADDVADIIENRIGIYLAEQE